MNNREYDNFDELVDDYREVHTENIKLSGESSEYFAEFKILEIKNFLGDSIRFLDFGCGDGAIYPFFNKHFPNSDYVGIDVSEKSIDKSKGLYPNANFTAYNGERFPLEDNSVDVFFAACVFHHIEARLYDAIFSEVNRVLKKGGQIIIFEHNPYNPITRHMVNTCEFDKDAVLISPYGWKKYMTKIDYDFRINFVLFFPRHKMFKLFHTTEKYLKRIPMGGQYYLTAIKK